MVQGRTGTGNVVPLMVRVPEDLRDRIKTAADANGRSQNSEIVATLEEKYPAPERWFNMEKYKAHQEFVERRSAEILSEIDSLVSQYANPGVDVGAIKERCDALFAEHKALFDYDIEEDRFHDIEPRSESLF